VSALNQNQLVLPILEVLEGAGGSVPTSVLYDQVAARVGVEQDVRSHRAKVGNTGQSYNLYERSVRWAQQRAKLQGLIERVEDCHWRLTGKGKNTLRAAAPGVVITIFTTEHGVALYGHAEDAVGHIDDDSVQLILTSPPYPLLREKEYGNLQADEYIEWLLGIAKDWPRKLTSSGSIVLNLADVWERGRPSISLYQERLLLRLVDDLGLRLCARYAWLNPSKMPAPAEWVTVRRVRVKPSLEQVYWLSPHDHPYADNRQVLRPYSASMKARIADGGEKRAVRPSGYQHAAGAFGADNGGSIPDNLIVASNTTSNSVYIRSCKEHGLPVHPARWPGGVPEHFIKMLTRKGDVVYDPFGGSLKTGEVAERLKRKWICSELNLEYLLGARNRFAGVA
jgi:site-specific DNA-methyltransferase (cytosine-N4-specific)